MRKLLVLIFSVLALSLAARADVQSGLAPGAITPPFHPQHVAGPDAGTNICPV